MTGSHRYLEEPDVEFIARREDVRAAKCQDPMSCTLALAGQRAIGFPVRVVFDDLTGDISIAWNEPVGAEGKYRYHRGILEPTNQAHRLLLLTDANKTKLMKQMRDRGEEEIRLTVTHHMSMLGRRKPRTEEEKLQEKNRAIELAELRAKGLAPPAKKRSGPKVSRGRGLRGIGLIVPEAPQKA